MPNRGQVNKNSFHSDTVRIGRSEEWGTELRGVADAKVGGRSYAHRQQCQVMTRDWSWLKWPVGKCSGNEIAPETEIGFRAFHYVLWRLDF